MKGTSLVVVVALALVCWAVASCSAQGGDTSPQQITLAFAGTEGTGMAVSWQTTDNTKTSTVRYGVSSGDYQFNQTGVSSSYYEYYNHHVVLENLTPGTTYYYVVGDDAGGYSEEFNFVTAPNAFVPFTTTFYGDLGLYNGNDTREALIATLNEYHMLLIAPLSGAGILYLFK